MATKIIPEIDSFTNFYHLKIGLFSIFFLIIFFFSFNKFNFDKNIPFNVYFNYVEGLTNGSDVEISGIKVGEVTNINLLNNQVLVSGFIDKTYDIPEDSIAIIRSNGIFGKKTLLIEPGFGDIMLKNNYVFINSKDSYSIDMFLRYLNNLNE